MSRLEKHAKKHEVQLRDRAVLNRLAAEADPFKEAFALATVTPFQFLCLSISFHRHCEPVHPSACSYSMFHHRVVQSRVAFSMGRGPAKMAISMAAATVVLLPSAPSVIWSRGPWLPAKMGATLLPAQLEQSATHPSTSYKWVCAHSWCPRPQTCRRRGHPQRTPGCCWPRSAWDTTPTMRGARRPQTASSRSS